MKAKSRSVDGKASPHRFKKWHTGICFRCGWESEPAMGPVQALRAVVNHVKDVHPDFYGLIGGCTRRGPRGVKTRRKQKST